MHLAVDHASLAGIFRVYIYALAIAGGQGLNTRTQLLTKSHIISMEHISGHLTPW